MTISQPLNASTKTHTLIQTDSLPFLGAHQEKWYLKVNDPFTQRAFWIEWSLSASRNGFKKSAEILGIFFERGINRELKKTAVKQTFDIHAFSRGRKDSIQIGNSSLQEGSTQGQIQSKGQTFQWDLTFRPTQTSTFNLVPEILNKLGVSQHLAITPYEDLIFTGTVQVNGETIQFNSARGMLGRSLSPKSWHSWVWGHCNTFKDEKDRYVDFVFEGLTTRSQLGPFLLPRVSTFYFRYHGQDYVFNRISQALSLQSRNTLNEWTFQADQGELSFRGQMKAEHKDFAGLTLEDTNGSLLYSSNSKLSELKLLIYRKGKLEAALNADGTAAFEVVSRQKNPYVPILV